MTRHRDAAAATAFPVTAGVSARDERHLHESIRLAAAGPVVDANPRVGCVVVTDDGQVVGTGFHRGAGHPHAEVVALAQAGERARAATAYVSLEPCAHTGATGPCVQALLGAGVARVVYADADPGVASGGGGALLAAAGVAVAHHPVSAAHQLNRAWHHAVSTGRPLVTWKIAATLDGRIAASDGTSRWITGPQARADVHRWRATCGAVITGTGTALADDPHLSVRDGDRLAPVQPLRVVVGDRAVPTGARLRDDAAPTLFLPRCEPAVVLARLHERQIRHAFLECGPGLGAAFARAGLVDEVLVYLAPALLGAGPAAVRDLGIDTIADILRLELDDVAQVGSDVRLTLTPITSQEGP